MNIAILDETGELSAGLKTGLKKISLKVLKALGAPKDSELSVTFIHDKQMRELNREYRNIDRTTDVLSFPQGEGPGGTLLGDIIISIETSLRNSRRYGTAHEEEIKKLLVHGILHLLGYDHKKKREREEMREKEREILKSLEGL